MRRLELRNLSVEEEVLLIGVGEGIILNLEEGKRNEDEEECGESNWTLR